MQPSSVLLLTPRWARNGGVGAHVIASAGALAASGVRVGVLAAKVLTGERIPGVQVFDSPSLFDRHAAVDARLGAAAVFAADAFHLHQVDEPELVQLLRARAPVLVSAHGYTACTSGLHYFRPGQECTRAHGGGCAPRLVLRGCAHTRRPDRLPADYTQASRGAQALLSADLAVSYSAAIDRHLAANGVARRAVVPLFGTLQPSAGSGHAERRRIVFAGRVVTPKGVAVLIRAARRIDAELVICGDGWQLPAMRRLAQRLGVQARVRFRGWLAERDVAGELANASVVAIPSLWPEPFGLVGIEALAAGRPVIASHTGGIGEWLCDGVNGLAVRPGDVRALASALDELLDDPRRQAELGEAGRRMVAERFSPERHVTALTDAYRQARSTWEPERGRPVASSRDEANEAL